MATERSAPTSSSQRRRRCPRCGERDAVPIVWGYVGADVGEEWRRREVVIGGCLIPSHDPPRWHCHRCELEWVRRARRPRWRWVEGVVAESEGHLALHRAEDQSIAAMVGGPRGGVFPVRFLTPDPAVIAEVRRELDLYLVETGGDDPWSNAIYQSDRAPGAYSRIRWSFRPAGTQEPGPGHIGAPGVAR